MSHPSKQKGNRFEREIVNLTKDAGLDAERAYGSNGKALGFTEDVDVVIRAADMDFKAQMKIRATIADYIKPAVTVDLQVIRENRGEPLAVIRYKDLLDLLVMLNNNQNQQTNG